MKWTQKVNRSRLLSTLVLTGTCLGDWLLREVKGVLLEGSMQGRKKSQEKGLSGTQNRRQA